MLRTAGQLFPPKNKKKFARLSRAVDLQKQIVSIVTHSMIFRARLGFPISEHKLLISLELRKICPIQSKIINVQLKESPTKFSQFCRFCTVRGNYTVVLSSMENDALLHRYLTTVCYIDCDLTLKLMLKLADAMTFPKSLYLTAVAHAEIYRGGSKAAEGRPTGFFTNFSYKLKEILHLRGHGTSVTLRMQ